jgi:hypothetical protein
MLIKECDSYQTPRGITASQARIGVLYRTVNGGQIVKLGFNYQGTVVFVDLKTSCSYDTCILATPLPSGFKVTLEQE